MVKHVILWTLKDEYTAEEKARIKEGIKTGLEGLKGKVPGLVEIKVYTNGLETSNADLMLDSTLESFPGLNYPKIITSKRKKATIFPIILCL